MLIVRSLAAALVAALSVSASLAAQSSGRVSGRVLDQTGAPLPGVAVELVSHLRTHQTTVTDAAGAYQFDGLTSGSAELTFRLINFSAQRRTVAVANTTPTIVDVVLALSLSA